MSGCDPNQELVAQVYEALRGRSADITDEQKKNVDFLTGAMEKLPQFVEYTTDEIRTAVKKVIGKA